MMSEASGAVILEEVETSGAARARREPAAGAAAAPEQGTLRCGGCAVWPRQQTWLCVVPLLIGCIGLGLSLLLLKWIVVGSGRDYVPTDLVDAKGIGQDPIFLSKPSAFPKSSDTTTTVTTTTAAATNGLLSTTPVVATATKGRTRAGAPPGNAPPRGGASGSQVTQRNGGTTTRFVTRGPTFTTTTGSAATPVSGPTSASSTSGSSPSNPTLLNDSTQMWTHEHSTGRSAATPTRTSVNRKTPSPTLPPLRSEHFKQCQEKDLAYCLNDGECFVIETLSGPHKHCKCKEGFQGIRCDQFLPKTDSILSDPNHLGIEFMESKEVYKRQVLSITCIAVAISLLGTLCMALYCRNKRRREKLQAHLKETRSLKNYSVGPSGHKSSPRLQTGLQLQKYCKSTRSSTQLGDAVRDSRFVQGATARPHSNPRGLSAERHHRSGSLSCSPEQRSRTAPRTAQRKTPPIPRGRLNPIGGTRDSGPAYQHLQEIETLERERELARGPAGANDLRQDSFHSMQPSWDCESGVPSHHPDGRSSRTTRASPTFRNHLSPCSSTPVRSCPVPIIPSMHASQDEDACMQTTAIPGNGHNRLPHKSTVEGAPANQQPTSPATGAGQQEVVLLLEEAQEQLRALAHAHRKQEDTTSSDPQEAKETVCILLSNRGGPGGMASTGPTETQLVSPRDTCKDFAPPGQ